MIIVVFSLGRMETHVVQQEKQAKISIRACSSRECECLSKQCFGSILEVRNDCSECLFWAVNTIKTHEARLRNHQVSQQIHCPKDAEGPNPSFHKAAKPLLFVTFVCTEPEQTKVTTSAGKILK